jgi:HK97 family phage major capsid protein
MSTSIQALRERRAAVAQNARQILDENTGDKWTVQLGEKVDALYGEIASIDNRISTEERAIQIEAADKVEHFHAADHEPLSHKVLFNKWMRGGDNALNAAEWTAVRNTMSTTTNSEGGFTMPSLISSTLYDAMKAFGAVRVVADNIKTADGRPLSFPTSDGTAEVGEIIAQNVTATSADPSFGTVALNVFKYSSKIVAAPVELIQDSTIDIEAFIRNRLAQRLGRIGNAHFTTGTGSGQPNGIATAAGAGKTGATGQTATIIFDDLIDMIHSVDPAYRSARSAFMTNDGLLRVIRKLKDSQNRPLWVPSFERGIVAGVGASSGGGYSDQSNAVVFDTLLGYPLFVNNDIAAPAASAKSLFFGDFSYYKVRDAMDVQMFRFTDSAYTKLGQVGFLAWARMGGNLVDSGAVKAYTHSAT